MGAVGAGGWSAGECAEHAVGVCNCRLPGHTGVGGAAGASARCTCSQAGAPSDRGTPKWERQAARTGVNRGELRGRWDSHKRAMQGVGCLPLSSRGPRPQLHRVVTATEAGPEDAECCIAALGGGQRVSALAVRGAVGGLLRRGCRVRPTTGKGCQSSQRQTQQGWDVAELASFLRSRRRAHSRQTHPHAGAL